MRRPAGWLNATVLMVIAVAALLAATYPFARTPTPDDPRPTGWQDRGRSDPAFTQPSLAPGVDYTVPSEAEIKQVLDRIREHFEQSTPYRVIDTATGQAITEPADPSKTGVSTPSR